MEDGGVQILVGTYRAIGIGQTIVMLVCFVALLEPWSLKTEEKQAIARVWRKGQTEDVVAWTLFYRDVMVDTIIRERRDFRDFLDRSIWKAKGDGEAKEDGMLCIFKSH